MRNCRLLLTHKVHYTCKFLIKNNKIPQKPKKCLSIPLDTTKYILRGKKTMYLLILLHQSLVESVKQNWVKNMIQHLDGLWHGILLKYQLITKVPYPTLKLTRILKKIKLSKFKLTPFKMRPKWVISRAPNKFQISM